MSEEMKQVRIGGVNEPELIQTSLTVCQNKKMIVVTDGILVREGKYIVEDDGEFLCTSIDQTKLTHFMEIERPRGEEITNVNQ